MKKFSIIFALATLGVVANAQVVFQTGFEAPGFAVGPIINQNGFTTFNADANGPIISTANPKSGNQHLRLPDNPLGQRHVERRVLAGLLRWDWSANRDPRVLLHSDQRCGGADYDFIAQSVGQSQLVFRLKFEFLGTVVVVDDLDGAGTGARRSKTPVSLLLGANGTTSKW